ncbi:RICIN domain-containing protein [Streptomyces regalis]|uniref:RICIN domain-containing protein n=1 Tax=Streptomyces regalis TaxID=68262 RepID=UPI000A4B8B6F
MQQVQQPVHAGEVVLALSGLQQCPGEDADADHGHPGLAHQTHVLGPDFLGPLLGVVVAAVGGAGQAKAALSAHSQKWTLIDAGNGYYRLRNVNSTLVAGVAQSSTTDGAAIVQWNSLNVDDQLWKIVRIN